MTEPQDKDMDRKRRIRNSALLFGAVAVLFYIGFIALSAMRG